MDLTHGEAMCRKLIVAAYVMIIMSSVTQNCQQAGSKRLQSPRPKAPDCWASYLQASQECCCVM